MALTPDASDTTAASHAAPTVVSALSAGSEAPVDAERVATIKQAIAGGTYPLVPAKIADAMVAGGLMLRKAR